MASGDETVLCAPRPLTHTATVQRYNGAAEDAAHVQFYLNCLESVSRLTNRALRNDILRVGGGTDPHSRTPRCLPLLTLPLDPVSAHRQCPATTTTTAPPSRPPHIAGFPAEHIVTDKEREALEKLQKENTVAATAATSADATAATEPPSSAAPASTVEAVKKEEGGMEVESTATPKPASDAASATATAQSEPDPGPGPFLLALPLRYSPSRASPRHPEPFCPGNCRASRGRAVGSRAPQRASSNTPTQATPWPGTPPTTPTCSGSSP